MNSIKKDSVSSLPTTISATKDNFEELVFHASQGDRRAIGALAIAFYPALLAEARAVLAPKDRRADAPHNTRAAHVDMLLVIALLAMLVGVVHLL